MKKNSHKKIMWEEKSLTNLFLLNLFVTVGILYEFIYPNERLLCQQHFIFPLIVGVFCWRSKPHESVLANSNLNWNFFWWDRANFFLVSRKMRIFRWYLTFLKRLKWESCFGNSWALGAFMKDVMQIRQWRKVSRVNKSVESIFRLV